MRIEVRGVLGILDLLIARRVVSRGQAAAGLRAIMAEGSFLPAAECASRLSSWEA